MKWYLIKVAGSTGNIFDFSQAEVATDEKLCDIVRSYGGDVDSMEIRYHCFDQRIRLHSWHLLADHSGYKKQHIVWIYSQTDEHPYLSRC